MFRRPSGFTLVEIAIVLVIVGLLLGGVMKGQELINSAKVKNFANDFRNIPLFVYGYQDKYKAVPGDDAGVDAHLGAALCPANASCKASAAGQVQGNGSIEGAWNSNNGSDESYRFWQHVRLAGLATGPTAVGDPEYLPKNAAGSVIGITGGASSPIATLRGTYIACSQGILGKFAKQLDITLDDGNTGTGAMQTMPNPTAVPQTAAVAAVPLTGQGAIEDDASYTVCLSF
ncbi:MAG: prepilin-type N-terminal cleavage/methylation domain-containing protein [Rhodocyclales bacterium]|nr:prepilin-type N-terminal cleavage/methylation domain-containing protein [Rhodocyclales bacterium]